MKSPSQCPGTARSAASAGQALIITSGLTNFLPRTWVRARGTRSALPVRRHAASSRRSAPRPCGDDLKAEASAEAARLESKFTDEDLERLIRAKGLDANRDRPDSGAAPASESA